MTMPSPRSRPDLPATVQRWLWMLVGLILLVAASPVAAQDAPPTPAEAAGELDAEATRAPDAAGALQHAAEVAAVLGAPDPDAPRVSKSFSNVELSLLADRRAVAPGGSVRLAARFDLDDEWHVYDGRNPGSIGLPTEVLLDLPDGFVAEPASWPAPELYKEASGDVSYVHHGELVVATTVAVPDSVAAGETVRLAADYDFQFCYDKCVRKHGTLELNLPVLDAGARGTNQTTDFAEIFERAEARAAVVDTDLARGALSHTPLVPGGVVAAVVEILPAGGNGKLGEPDADHTPTVVFDKLEGIDVETLQVSPTAAGGLQILARVSAGEDFDPAADGSSFGATVQVDSTNADAPLAYRAPLALRLAPEGTAVTALDSPLLADVDVAALTAPAADNPSTGPPAMPSDAAALPLWMALLLAFAGGLLLNLMPCVLPALSLKALILVEEANSTQQRTQAHAAFYVFGILVSFWALAAAIIAVKLSGQLVGWGFQFQEPGYVITMIVIVFAFALSLFGVFEVPGLTMSGESSGGLKGSFVHGVLTTALSTPCSAPLLGSALTFALAQSPATIVLIFTCIGLGLAAPLVTLTLWPAARRFIPKPGPWMETFKHVIGFMLVGTVIWLLGVLTAQLTSDAMATVFVLLGAVSMAGWMLGRFTGPLATVRRKAIVLTAAAAVVAGGVSYLSLEVEPFDAEADLSTDLIAWEAFRGDDTMKLAADGHTLFIDFTADWCATCKTFEATAIETDAVSELIKTNKVRAFKADLTRKNPELSRWVEHFGRSAIPLYVVVPANRPDAPIVMPEAITESMVLETLRKAGPSTSGARSQADDDPSDSDPPG